MYREVTMVEVKEVLRLWRVTERRKAATTERLKTGHGR